MPVDDGDYVVPDEDDRFESLAQDVITEEGDANPRAPQTLVNALLRAAARTNVENTEQSLQDVYRAAYIADASDADLTKKAQNLGVVRKSATQATGVVTFSRSNAASTDYTIPSGTVVETIDTDPVAFETVTTVTLQNGDTSVDATIEAVDGGTQGNVGPNSIQSLPSPPTGIEDVNNAQATGDPALTDVQGDPLVAGRDRESDAELRNRVLETDATVEGPAAGGIDLALTQTEGVQSVDVNTNQTGSTVNGIDPYKTEVVVFGGDTLDVVTTLRDTMSVTTFLRLQGGVNGTKKTETVTVDLLDQDVTAPITRPNELTFDLEIDVVHTGNYVGTDAVKNEIVRYVGGTFTDGSTTSGGLGINQNVLINELENRVEDLQGVDFADKTLLDTDTDSNDDTTTDSDGVPILSVSGSQIPRVDAANITVSETAR